MKLFLECKMGAAGDMIMAALFELLTESQQNDFLNTMNGLFPDAIKVYPAQSIKCGISGTHMHVETLGVEEGGHNDHDHNHNHNHDQHHHDHDHNHEHSHSHDLDHDNSHEHSHVHYTYQTILDQLHTLVLPNTVKQDAAAIYKLIGQAEAKVHDSTLEHIHFHEVGSLDAICDVVGCSLAMYYLKPAEVIASPIHVGNGIVNCAHGKLQVPTPATAEILKGIPYYTGNINSELCTPTGAAILKHFVTKFGPMPTMSVEAVGLGMGNKDFEIANCVRIFLGDVASNYDDKICQIECNLDDITGEELGYAMDLLFDNGALDVYYTSIYMKKNRPGILLRVLCPEDQRDKFIQLVLKHTTTRGLRFTSFERAKLDSHFETIQLEGYTIRNKVSEGYGVSKSKYEFDDIKAYASGKGISIKEAQALLDSL